MTVNVKERKHPKGMKLSEALAEDKPRLKAMKGLTDKKTTLVAAADSADSEVAGELRFESLRPTDEQLARINSFTRETKTADEVATFRTLSCNDIVDRDDDRFKTDCVKGFADLAQPFSPTGKSFMMDHGRSVTQQIGRIYGTETKKLDGNQWLINEVYVPNTEKNASYLEDVSFGVHWAVSVGVVLGKTECSVCKSPFSSWGWWCQEGHDKGLWYDPNSTETDNYGYPVPCDPKTKGAIKCVRDFDDPIDMYELSQVFLGAQYFAALDKDPAFRGALKAASADLPILGLSAEEAAKLPIHHEPKQVSEARILFGVAEDEDGSLNWTDDKGIRWTFDPEEPEEGVQSLGRTTAEDNEDNDDDSDDESEEENEDGDEQEQLPAGSDDSSGDEEDESEQDASAGDRGPGSGSDPGTAPVEQSGGEPGQVTDGDEEESSDKAAVIAAAKRLNLSDSAIKAAEKASGNGLVALLSAVSDETSTLRKKIEELAPKASLGDTYVEELRADAIDWYVKAHRTKDSQKVATENFMKILNACGSDVELIKVHIEEQRKLAQEKFPASVRRSSFPSDPNARKESDPEDEENFFADVGNEDGQRDERVKRIHG